MSPETAQNLEEQSPNEQLVDDLRRVLRGGFSSVQNLANACLNDPKARSIIFKKVSELIGKAYLKISGNEKLSVATKISDEAEKHLSGSFSKTGVELFDLLGSKDILKPDKETRFFELLAEIYNRVVRKPSDTPQGKMGIPSGSFGVLSGERRDTKMQINRIFR